MKTTHVLALYSNSGKREKISNSLQIAGFSADSVDCKIIDQSILAIDVTIHDEYDQQMAHNILDFYLPFKTIEIDNLAKSDIETTVHSLAKAEIVQAPVIRHRKPHYGITSEVNFG